MHSCSSPENHIRIPVQNGQSLYPFSDQKGPKAPSFGAANTYMAYIREYLPSLFQPKQIKTCAIVCRPLKSCARTRKIQRVRGNYFFTIAVHDTSHHICKQCLRKLQKRRGLRIRQAFRRKPAKETKIFI